MDRFTKFEIDLAMKDTLEITGKFNAELKADIYVDLNEIIAFRVLPKEDYEDARERTCFYLKSGENFTVNNTISEFIEIMNNFQKKIVHIHN